MIDGDVRAALQAALAGTHEVLDEIPGGGMSRVFMALEQRLGRKVVVKVLSPVLGAGVSASRFEREIQLLASLQHPNIVPLLSAGETAEGLPFYVMPLVEGRSLAHRLGEGSLPLDEALDILRAVAAALEAAHARGIVHRDIKPANVLLAGRSAVVTDFGIAKALSDARTESDDDGLTGAGVSLGTPAYMSPEQASGEEVDARADLYSWGVLAYELLSGRHPFAHHSSPKRMIAAHLTEVPAALEPPQGIARSVVELVRSCLEKDPARRPASATALVTVLRDAATAQEIPRLSRATRAAILAAIVFAASGAIWGWRRFEEKSWATDVAPSAIAALADSGHIEDAFAMAMRALAVAPDDTILGAATASATGSITISSSPIGATVFRRLYEGADTTWRAVGVTPVESLLVPAGPMRIRIDAPGYRSYQVVARGPVRAKLQPVSDTAMELVPVPPSRVIAAYFITGLGHLPPETVPAFEFGRFEVSNREFQTFVDAGGYSDPQWWATAITRNGLVIPWREAMQSFRDATGQQGPATWDLGKIPSGAENKPVTGISWYEADAFARFKGLQLPTIYHWMQGATTGSGASIVPYSNVSGSSLAPVGSFRGMSAFGAFDVAGNAREWVANSTGNDRYALGGSYADPAYLFSHVQYLDPFDRAAANGMRLARYTRDSTSRALERAIAPQVRDVARERPASDAVFDVYRRLYDYDAAPLDDSIVAVDTSPLWIRRRVTYASPTPGERVIAYLFLPRSGTAPFQTLIFFPGAQSLVGRAPMPAGGYGDVADEVVKTGRAFLHPIYPSTYERRNENSVGTWYPNDSRAYRDLVLSIGKEFRRSVDYLYSKPTLIDTARIGYFGLSWGGYMSGIMMGIEPRLRAAVLLCPGLTLNRPQPEVDPLQFLPRVKIPVLMVGGRFDAIFPMESSFLPMYRLLGSPTAVKRMVEVPDAAHCPERRVFWSEALPWLDRHLGPRP